MIHIEGNEQIPALWPGGSLASFGQTPDGKNIWRVVWSESVNHLFGARWQDTGFVGYRYIPSYKGMKCYVLEKWLTPYQFDKCTEELWNQRHKDPDTGLLQLGPYPSKGVYYGPFWDWDGYPTLGAVEAAIGILTKCEDISEHDKQVMLLKAKETDKLMRVNEAKEIIMESLPLSVTTGCFLPSGMKRAEDVPERLSAQDVQKITGLPLGKNKSFTTGTERV